jgi:hypothetical protein
MKLGISNELKEICINIMNEKLSIESWKEIESSDMFQTENFCGGFDACEEAFLFSYYSAEREYWFQLNLKDMEEIVLGSKISIDLQETK